MIKNKMLLIVQYNNTYISFSKSRMLLVTISVISVDFATQAAINPCESLMADISKVFYHPSKWQYFFLKILRKNFFENF